MSETVHYKGKLNLVCQTQDKSFFEDVCKELCIKRNFKELYDFYETWEEQLRSELYEKYVIVHDEFISVYEVLSQINIDDYEMFNVSKLSDTEYDYEVMYYNGCMGLSEAIEESFYRLGE